MPKHRQPKQRTRRFPAWPSIGAVNLYGSLRCEVIITVDKNVDGIVVRHPRNVRCEQMTATLAIRGPKGRHGNLAVTQERPDGTLFVLSPTEGEPEGTLEITVPNLARSSSDICTSGMIAVGVHNDSKSGRARSSGPGDIFYLGDPGAYKEFYRPTFEK